MDEQFFENLANGKMRADDIAGEAEEEKEMEAEETVAEKGNFEVELAKANTSAVASKKSRAKQIEKAEPDWDEEPEGQLTVDVYQTPNDIVIESAIAGVRPEDIDINVTTDSISIKGLRYHQATVDDKDYLYRECYWGRFSRSIILPQEIEPENAEVMFRNGILTIRLPKSNRKKTKKLKVRID